MIRQIAWNLLVPSSLSPSAQALFNSMWVVALHFASSAVDMDTSKHVTSGKDLPSFPGVVLFLSVSPLWKNVTAAGGACTWQCGAGFLYQHRT